MKTDNPFSDLGLAGPGTIKNEKQPVNSKIRKRKQRS